MDAAAAHLLDFTKPFDIALLEQIIAIAYDAAHPARAKANEFLIKIKEHPEMWRRADAILESSKEAYTKYFGLQVLGEAIDSKWKIIPQEQREGIRNYIIGKIVSLANTDASMKANHTFLSKLNLVLVHILKQDWPQNWPSFIGDIVNASKSSECLCENNMKILQLLSEEIFDFSSETMTSAKVKHLKESLNSEFSQIFQLCEFILAASQKKSLLLATLVTLQRFLSWIALGYIFQTSLLNTLINKFLCVPDFRTETVNCLIEIASLPPSDIQPQYTTTTKQLLISFMVRMVDIIPREAPLAAAYESGSEEACLFVQRLSLFLGTFLKNYIHLFVIPSPTTAGVATAGTGNDAFMYEETAVEALMYLVRISEVDDEEIFKTCLEFWHFFSREIYQQECAVYRRNNPGATSMMGMGMGGGIGSGAAVAAAGGSAAGTMSGRDDDGAVSPLTDLDEDDESGMGQGGAAGGSNNRLNLSGANSSSYRSSSVGMRYHEMLHRLRNVTIDKMAKPEEVIIVEDDNGNIVREMTKDTEVIAQYKTMREVIVYLTNLNYEETELIMLEKLDLQVEGGKFSWNGLNTLCWAIGSISGAMNEQNEKRFLVTVIKDLLRLCEEQRGKDNKAVVASNIMYIVGQYPRFLRAHWKFLKTVVNKLFEFMHELHPGVQDMACDTFLKIAQKCKRKFVTQQADEAQPFILTLISALPRHTGDLQPHQVQSFYESVGTMISDKGYDVSIARDDAVIRLMEGPNRTWSTIVNGAAQSGNMAALYELNTTKELSRVLKINTRVCAAAGSIYVRQLSIIFLDAMNIYRLFSEHITQACAAQGEIATRLTNYKQMRVVKSDILELLTVFLEVSHDLEGGHTVIMNTFMPAIMAHVLMDYKSSPPAARDAKVLKLFSTVVSSLKSVITSQVPNIMASIFEPTLALITTNMMDHPEHRTEFFHFLRVANEFCFFGLFSIPAAHQKLVIDSIVWAFKHTERNISEEGLEILLAVLRNIDSISATNNEVAQGFYTSFMLSLISEIFNILTDRLHKSGFKLQADVLHHIFAIVLNGKVTKALYDANVLAQLGVGSTNGNLSNVDFIRLYVSKVLCTAFPNVAQPQINAFVLGLLDVRKDNNAFKMHLRDFLVTVKEFSSGGDNNTELFQEEAEAEMQRTMQQQRSYLSSVPGLISQSEALSDEPEL